MAYERCDPLAEPDPNDLMKTTVLWGLSFKLCKLKHDILIECTKK